MISVSIVSHGHGDMIVDLVSSLKKIPEITQIILTLNIPEDIRIQDDEILKIITNSSPKGYGANHNSAFNCSINEYFCVLNPDIRILRNPFPLLLNFINRESLGLVSPKIVNLDNIEEDSMRYFPTIYLHLKKLLGFSQGIFKSESNEVYPDWVGGMFMLFTKEAYQLVKGFDESFFLYYEDVDICARLMKNKIKVGGLKTAVAVHNARRDSRVNYKYMKFHAKSLIRYYLKYLFRLPKNKH